jgi:hypothetical protein
MRGLRHGRTGLAGQPSDVMSLEHDAKKWQRFFADIML